MPREGEIQRISYSQLRDMLRQGFEEVLSFLPEGDEPLIKMVHNDDRGQLIPMEPEERRPLEILRDSASAISALAEIHSVEDVRWVLVKENVVQMIVSEDEIWRQIYVD